MAASSRPGPFRLLFGDEDHLLNGALRELKTQKSREVTVFEGDGLDAQRVVSFCETWSDLLRGVVVDNAHKLKNLDVLTEYVKNKDPNDKTLVVVFAVRSSSIKAPWMKAAAEKGRVVQFMKPKPWETDKQISKIQAEAKKHKVRLGKGVPEFLLKVLGYDLALISNELGKASYLTGDTREVTKEMVASLIPHVFPTQPFEVAEAAASKRPKHAMTLLGFVYRNLGDGASIPVTYALMKLVERLLVARNLSDRGIPEREIASRLGVHEYVYKVNLLPLVRRHTVAQLADHMKNLCRLDTLVKGSAVSKRTHVELAILSLAT